MDAGLITVAASDTCPGGPSCERVVFVSSISFKAAQIGGIKGADLQCNVLANFSSNPRVHGRDFVAWLSDSTTSPQKRMVKGTKTYIRPDSSVIAQDFAALTSGKELENAISIDEDGDEQSGEVWTGTGPLGNANGGDCEGWTGGDANGNKGEIVTGSPRWTSSGPPLGAPGLCPTDEGRIYCFEK
jgi:hypothetical protein